MVDIRAQIQQRKHATTSGGQSKKKKRKLCSLYLCRIFFLMVYTVKEIIFVSKSVEGLNCSTEFQPVVSPLTIDAIKTVYFQKGTN